MSTWIVDEAHSTIGFEVTHMMVSKVKGRFDSYTAEIKADDLSDLTNADISIQIKADSVNTRNKERDQHLNSVDFFDTIHYPLIEFYSTEIKRKLEKDRYIVQGNLTIKGITRVVEFDVTFGGKAVDLWGNEVVGYEAEAVINREEFGLLWNASLEAGGVVVGKEIKVNVDFELKRKTDLESNSNQIENQIKIEDNQDKIVASSDFHKLIAENLTDLVVLMDRNGDIKHFTPSLKRMLGYSHSSFKHRNFFDCLHPTEKWTVHKQIESYASRAIKNNVKSCEFQLLHQKGYYVEVEADINHISDKDLLLLIIRDISEQKEAEKVIYQLAFHDSLTELPNRRSFLYQLRSELIDLKNKKNRHSLLFIDLDNFKSVNDKWGHSTGDAVLKKIANGIRSVVRPTDIVARFGGDEFVILLKDIPDEKFTEMITKRLLDRFKIPIEEENQQFTISLSIGVAHYPMHGESPEELVNNASIALHRVKEQGKNDFIIYNEVLEKQSLERRILENALRKAIKEQQFYLEYQPKVNIKTNEVIGMEALVRWNHPELGTISPGKFIPLAEETGLIIPLGEWILRESCRQAVEWRDEGYPPLILSVNISVLQLQDPNFFDLVQEVLDESGFEPIYLELELTESIFAENLKNTIAVLKEVRKLGVTISIDDFGTGYSSLSYVKELPIDTIKIDRAFVKDIHKNKESKEIAKALINLANSIGLNTIAEGIEQKEHVEALRRDGYLFGQGFYYSKPLKPDAFEDYMKDIHRVS